jgi:hypothetical protein
LALGLVTPPGYFLSTPVNNHSLNAVPPSAAFSGDERWLAIASYDGDDSPRQCRHQRTDDIFVIDLPDYLDADDDSMDDRWEALFGGPDPAGDPDGDGQTNAQEEDAGTHPNGQVQRFLAEGATGSFFHTTIALPIPARPWPQPPS